MTSVSCGGEFSLALSDDGKIYAWGNPQYGQLGDGSDHQYIGNNNRVLLFLNHSIHPFPLFFSF